MPALYGYAPDPRLQQAYLNSGTPSAPGTPGTPYTPSGNNGSNSGTLPSNYADIVAANTAARMWQLNTPGGQTAVGVNADNAPDASQASFINGLTQGNAFRSPKEVQDFRTANGNPLSAEELANYSKLYNSYIVSQHPGGQGIRGWMHDHPVGVIAAFIALAAGGAALSGAAAGGGAAGGGAGGGAAGGGGAVGGAAGGGGALGGAAGGGAIGAESALPEIVVTGSAGGGAGALGAAGAAGAVGAGLGSTAGSGSGTGLQNSSGNGIFSNGGQGGMASAGGGNAGALEASGGIGGGAGIGGTTGGALGPLSGVANSVSGAGGGSMGAGTSSWMDWIPSLISAGSSLYAGSKAAGATDAAARQALAENARQFDLVRSDTQPQRELGNAAVGRIAGLYGYGTADGKPDMSGFFESPDYQFNLAEGQKAIDRSAAARGGLLSGAAVKEGTRYASGMASREYGSFVDRLMQQAGLGSNGTAASAAAGANSASNVANIAQNQGNARASIYTNTAQDINNSAQAGYSNYMLRRYLGG